VLAKGGKNERNHAHLLHFKRILMGAKLNREEGKTRKEQRLSNEKRGTKGGAVTVGAPNPKTKKFTMGGNYLEGGATGNRKLVRPKK